MALLIHVSCFINFTNREHITKKIIDKTMIKVNFSANFSMIIIPFTNFNINRELEIYH